MEQVKEQQKSVLTTDEKDNENQVDLTDKYLLEKAMLEKDPKLGKFEEENMLDCVVCSEGHLGWSITVDDALIRAGVSKDTDNFYYYRKGDVCDFRSKYSISTLLIGPMFGRHKDVVGEPDKRR